MPEPSPIHRQFLPDVYRYAFLVTGSAATAAEVLRSTVESASRGPGDDDRKVGRAKRWLFAKAREFCLQPPPARPASAPLPPTAVAAPAPAAETAAAPVSDAAVSSAAPVPTAAREEPPLPAVPAPDDAVHAPNRLAAFFAVLPERERSALVLFYLYIFDPAELAEVLEIKPAELGPLLNRARSLLQFHKVECASLLAHALAAPTALTPADTVPAASAQAVAATPGGTVPAGAMPPTATPPTATPPSGATPAAGTPG